MQVFETIRSYATAVAVVILAAGGVASAQCVGDCDGDGTVSVSELIRGVNINLGNQDVSACPAMDADGNGSVAVNELIQAVNNNLNGCSDLECVDAGDCDDGNACTDDSCADNTCSNEPVICQDDGNECTAASCDPETGCGSINVEDGTSCNDGAGACQGGVCGPPPVVEYEQDFESLDLMGETALSDEDWVVFGNVFDDQGGYRYGYGAFPAPNGGAAFSAIATGQGGPEQGDQQLSIYDDYNNADHAKGWLIESNVFQERTITADDVGKTLRFAFDAKRGNINDAADPLCPCTSTAFAFIKTLNPAAGFATTNLVQQETTALPDTWNRYTLTLAIDGGLVGQLLQVGFQANATLYQPSGVFYDNLVVSSTSTNP